MIIFFHDILEIGKKKKKNVARPGVRRVDGRWAWGILGVREPVLYPDCDVLLFAKLTELYTKKGKFYCM